MVIGVLREIKEQEYRVALPPSGAYQLAKRGHEVVVERGAGAGFPDAEYQQASAKLVASHAAVFEKADLMVKVKGAVAHRIQTAPARTNSLHLSPPCGGQKAHRGADEVRRDVNHYWNQTMKQTLTTLFILAALGLATLQAANAPQQRWPVEEADAWARQTGWLAGCNFTPSTAANELEMWQADTFDPKTIDRELGWAHGLGFNCVRVFLHNLLWQQDSKGFLDRMDQFLVIADKHHIKVVFVIFDSCWDPDPKLGPQPAPRPFVHNSRWLQCPGREYMAHPERLDELKPYVQGAIGHFRGDPRIAFWDLYNEPSNLNDSSYGKEEPANKQESALLLLKKVFVWARAMNPSQPLSSGVWGNWTESGRHTAAEEITKVQLGESDIITFHDYDKLADVKKAVADLRQYDRPLVCTEFMARPIGSTFKPVLGYFREQNIGAFNWGFVSGKTQTIYPWDSWEKTYTHEPPVWFHDILHPDGTPYRPAEVQYIRSITLGGAKTP